MSTVDEIKSRLNIVDQISEKVQLRKSGKNYTGFCPFHTNTRTPAFAVFPDTETWRCFGLCNEGGDIFGYVMKSEGWDFSETLRYLADKAGVQLRPPSPAEDKAEKEMDSLRKLLEQAADYFYNKLVKSEEGKPALDYLINERKLTLETIEKFKLGFAPKGWENLFKDLTSMGVERKDLISTGLVVERDELDDSTRKGTYDRFRNRVMFPIRDERGRMAGFGGRILNPKDVPKFLNSPQTLLFDKSRLLYGLDLARKEIRRAEQVVIVEGYLDVIALHQAGYSNVVSPMGTALSRQQLTMLKRFAKKIILALDPDAAGDQATLRGLQVARETLERETEPVFDSRGLISHESRLQADIRVATLPDGLDPDEVVLRDPEEWENSIKEAKPIVSHVMDVLSEGKDLDDPKVKTEIAGQVLPLIADVPSSIERSTYRQRLARLLKVDDRSLYESEIRVRKTRSTRRKPRPGQAKPRPASSIVSDLHRDYVLEKHCLGILIRDPEKVFLVDRVLRQSNLDELSALDFKHANHPEILKLIIESANQDLTEPNVFIFSNLSMDMMELADGLLEATENVNTNDPKVIKDLLRSLVDLRERYVHQDISHIMHLIEEEQDKGDFKGAGYQEKMKIYIKDISQLTTAKHEFSKRNNLL